MKILFITAGAAGMYCGSCFRDNALASELRALGHDVLLMPVYTATLTDEENASADRVLFGGISVYLQQHWPMFRRTPWVFDRLWDSKLALKLASRRSIPTSPQFLGEMTISMLQGEDGVLRKEFEKLVAWLASNVSYDVIGLPNSLLIGMARPIRRALNRSVCCTLQGEDLFLEGLPEPYRSRAIGLIREQVRDIDLFVAVSDYYAAHMAGYLNIPPARIRTVPLGIRFDGYPECPRPVEWRRPPACESGFRIGYFARIAPEKSLHVLAEAYRIARSEFGLPPSSLEVAGWMATENRAYLEEIERRMDAWGLGGEFHYRGVLDRAGKIAFLSSLDVLSVPSEYAEPKGIYVLEAMAAGVPVVEPRRGAFPEIIAKTGGGVLVEPSDPRSLAEGILAALGSRDLGAAAWHGVRRHYAARAMAERAAEVYASVCRPSRVTESA